MSLRSWWKRNVRKVKEVEVRARDEDGRFVADDPTTKKDEAWTTKDVPIEEKEKISS
jgi:hypothetical protein